MPLSLDTGLLLEDCNLLLRWGEVPDPHGDKKYFTWKDTVVLGGMKASVVARARDPMSVIYVHPAMLEGAKDESEQFDRMLTDLTSRFGPPAHRGTTESSLAAGLRYPKADWKFGTAHLVIRVIENNSFAYLPYFEMTVRSRVEL